jgi:hypothetical protein
LRGTLFFSPGTLRSSFPGCPALSQISFLRLPFFDKVNFFLLCWELGCPIDIPLACRPDSCCGLVLFCAALKYSLEE